VMKVRDGGNVPGVASQGACEETVLVIEHSLRIPARLLYQTRMASSSVAMVSV